VGFGIKDRNDVELAFQYADGATIGTKAVSELERELCFRMKYDPFLCFYSLKKG
jgi:tryptophan synthase alpha subunit